MSTDLSRLESVISRGRTLIFDLDDTIYDEKTFLFEQYRVVCEKYTPGDAIQALEFLKRYFLEHGRKGIFQSYISAFRLSASLDSVLATFRDYSASPALTPLPWFVELSENYSDKLRLIIVTNGNVKQQKEKVSRLNLHAYFDEVVVYYANATQPKPAVNSELMSSEKLVDPIYVGDSMTDHQFSLNSGFEFLNVRELMAE